MTNLGEDVPFGQILESASRKAKSTPRSGIGQRREAKRRDPGASAQPDSPAANFVARCEPQNPKAPFTSAGLSLYIGQLILRGAREELWESVIIRCDEQTDGTLTVRVVVSNPDWENRVQIAYIQSRPGDAASQTALACNLDHEDLRS